MTQPTGSPVGWLPVHWDQLRANAQYRVWEVFTFLFYSLLLLHPFNGLFSRTTCVSRHQKGKPFWILLEQEMMGWLVVYRPDHMPIICTCLQLMNEMHVVHLITLSSQTNKRCKWHTGQKNIRVVIVLQTLHKLRGYPKFEMIRIIHRTTFVGDIISAISLHLVCTKTRLVNNGVKKQRNGVL